MQKFRRDGPLCAVIDGKPAAYDFGPLLPSSWRHWCPADELPGGWRLRRWSFNQEWTYYYLCEVTWEDYSAHRPCRSEVTTTALWSVNELEDAARDPIRRTDTLACLLAHDMFDTLRALGRAEVRE